MLARFLRRAHSKRSGRLGRKVVTGSGSARLIDHLAKSSIPEAGLDFPRPGRAVGNRLAIVAGERRPVAGRGRQIPFASASSAKLWSRSFACPADCNSA